MNIPLIVTLLVFAFGAAFLYFVGAVIIQALRLSILQVKSDVKIKMDKHQHELEHQKIFLESKKLMLQGKAETPEKQPKKSGITTIELAIDGDTAGLKETLESIDTIKKFAIFKDNILLDIEEEISPTQIINEIEKKSKIKVSQVNFAKNSSKSTVKGRRE